MLGEYVIFDLIGKTLRQVVKENKLKPDLNGGKVAWYKPDDCMYKSSYGHFNQFQHYFIDPESKFQCLLVVRGNESELLGPAEMNEGMN